MMGDRLYEKAVRISRQGYLGGGKPEQFSFYGRSQLIALIRQGLNPDSKLLDMGCGCLRAGYWLIHFLNPDCYCGIEPNKVMLQAGVDELLDDEVQSSKRPRFDNNASFDFSVFGEKFDFFLARSIWTHASKAQIETMLDGFVAHSNDDAVFMASYKPPVPLLRPDYKGDEWVGGSHESSTPGIVRHSLSWIRDACGSRGLSVKPVKQDNFGTQRWLRVERKSA